MFLYELLNAKLDIICKGFCTVANFLWSPVKLGDMYTTSPLLVLNFTILGIIPCYCVTDPDSPMSGVSSHV